MLEPIDFYSMIKNYVNDHNPFGDVRISSTKKYVENTINFLHLHLNIFITNLEISALGFYTGKAVYDDFVGDITIYLYNPNSISIDFENLIVLENKMVSSPCDHPVIQSIVNDLNRSLPLLDSLRLSDDDVNYLPVFPYLRPSFSFSCDNTTHKLKLDVDFKVLVKSGMVELLLPYLLYANNQSIQSKGYSVERDIKKIYSVTGEVIRDDFEKYRSLMLKAFNLSEDSFDVDYVRLGLVNDMTNI